MLSTTLGGTLAPWRVVRGLTVRGARRVAPRVAPRVAHALVGPQNDPLVFGNPLLSGGGALGVVCAVGFPARGGLPGLYPVVVEDLALELRGYLPIIAEGRAVLDRLFVRRHLDELPPVVHTHDAHRD